ncbi:MAG: hypothetical protein KDC44_13190, partial [Phaeodactylibacter sp.]|nr:hypothetical protein [Phaeodactylibacter sp.]
RLDEEERFARTLRQVIQEHPDLKIVLSFRKEYFVEIRKLLDGASIDYLEKRLVALDRAGVLEAITGLTKTASAQRKYRLKIESNVPFKIANDILGGDSAHIATFLQILLRKMWKAVVDEEERIFSEDLYAQLRSASFEELIDRQIQKIQEVFPEQESSGLVLAVLQACTTEYGTAGAQSAKDLKEQYAHVKDFEALLEQLQQSLLLTYLSTTDEYRLPHDSLAPLIIKRFLKSDRPVQRAVRLLENAVSSQTGLSKDAYLLVKEARPWCRRFTTVEVQLLEQGGKRFFKETLKAWLQNNEVDRVLRNLEEKIIELNDLELFQQVAMYAFRYHSLTRDWYRGWITQNDYHIGHNLIVNGLEGFINDLKLFDFTRVEHQFLEALLEGDLKSALGL